MAVAVVAVVAGLLPLGPPAAAYYGSLYAKVILANADVVDINSSPEFNVDLITGGECFETWCVVEGRFPGMPWQPLARLDASNNGRFVGVVSIDAPPTPGLYTVQLRLSDSTGYVWAETEPYDPPVRVVGPPVLRFVELSFRIPEAGECVNATVEKAKSGYTIPLAGSLLVEQQATGTTTWTPVKYTNRPDVDGWYGIRMCPTVTGEVRATDTGDGMTSQPAPVVIRANPVPAPTGGLRITTHRLTTSPSYKRFTWQTAAVIGLTGAARTAANRYLTRMVDRDLKQPKKNAALTGYPRAGWFLHRLSSPDCATATLCVLAKVYEYFPGAAHGLSTISTAALDTRTGRPRTLSQYVKPADLPRFLRVVRARLVATGDTDAMFVNWLKPTYKQFSRWLPTPDGILVWFDQCMAGACGVGVLTVRIPWAQVRGLAK